MTNFAVARNLSGMTSAAVADATDSSRSYISQLESGIRNLGRNNVQIYADLLRCDSAWLLGQPGIIPVFDPIARTSLCCQVVRSEEIPGYGILYLAYLPETGDAFGVILADGVQFTVQDWQSGAQPRSADEIADYAWMDAAGNDAVMFDGLPRVLG